MLPKIGVLATERTQSLNEVLDYAGLPIFSTPKKATHRPFRVGPKFVDDGAPARSGRGRVTLIFAPTKRASIFPALQAPRSLLPRGHPAKPCDFRTRWLQVGKEEPALLPGDIAVQKPFAEEIDPALAGLQEEGESVLEVRCNFGATIVLGHGARSPGFARAGGQTDARTLI
jgi:hypothetical protein